MTTDFFPLPTHAAIIQFATELRADAVQARDDTTVRQLDRVIVALTCGAGLERRNGGLLVSSINTPGAVYATDGHRCTCQSSRPCWHMGVVDLIATLEETASDTADMEADAAALLDDPPPGDDEPGIGPTEGDETPPDRPRSAPLVLSPFMARKLLLIPALERTETVLEGLRLAQRPIPQLTTDNRQLTTDDSRARQAHGRRLATARQEVLNAEHISVQARDTYARAAASYPHRPLFAARDAEDARRQAKGELRTELEIVQAKRAAAREAAEAMNARV